MSTGNHTPRNGFLAALLWPIDTSEHSYYSSLRHSLLIKTFEHLIKKTVIRCVLLHNILLTSLMYQFQRFTSLD